MPSQVSPKGTRRRSPIAPSLSIGRACHRHLRSTLLNSNSSNTTLRHRSRRSTYSLRSALSTPVRLSLLRRLTFPSLHSSSHTRLSSSPTRLSNSSSISTSMLRYPRINSRRILSNPLSISSHRHPNRRQVSQSRRRGRTFSRLRITKRPTYRTTRRQLLRRNLPHPQ